MSYPGHSFGGLTPLQKWSWCILKLQLTELRGKKDISSKLNIIVWTGVQTCLLQGCSQACKPLCYGDSLKVLVTAHLKVLILKYDLCTLRST